MDLSRWKSGWAVAALSVVAVALITFFLALRGDSESGSPSPVQLVAAQDLTSQVRMEISDPQFDSAAGRYSVRATVVNRGNTPLAGPIVVSPYAGLKLADADGQFESGKDYVTLVPEGKQLEPGQRIQSRRIAMRDGKHDRRSAKNFRVWRGLALSGPAGPAVAAVPAAPTVGAPGAGAMQPIPQPVGEYPIPDQRIVNRVIAVQDAWTPRLLSVRGVQGTATGLTPDGEVVVQVYVDQAGVANNLPRSVDGVRVDAAASGTFSAFQLPPQDKIGQGGAPRPRPNPLCTDDPQVRFARPVPIGVSGMVSGQGCFSGTIGARVRGADGRLYALSNNHVFAAENAASVGDPIVQPSLGDGNCSFNQADVIGTLADFEPMDFTFTRFNRIDAAIAEVSAATLSNATPCSGFGAPNSVTVPAVLGMKVEKYGRTTSLRTGTIVALNATLVIGYSTGPAVFDGQIVVRNDLRFPLGQPGDSGSLIVTQWPNNNPVGLLFAGSAFFTLANPIDEVLQRFNVTIDGAPSNIGPAGR